MGCEKPAWLKALYVQEFFTPCSIHQIAKKNEKNVCCLDCCISICPHCIVYHRSHRLLQIRRYVYHEVVRLEDLQKLIDCSNIQGYTINAAKVVFIKKRPQNRQFKGSGNHCTSCDRCLQEPFIHCSLACKVDFVLKHCKDLSPFLKVCNNLQLSPDFIIPHDIMGDDDQMTNETLDSTTIVDSNDESLISSTGLENMGFNFSTEFVKKKRSNGLLVCGKVGNEINEKDMSTGMINRRKGTPHRSPLC